MTDVAPQEIITQLSHLNREVGEIKIANQGILRLVETHIEESRENSRTVQDKLDDFLRFQYKEEGKAHQSARYGAIAATMAGLISGFMANLLSRN